MFVPRAHIHAKTRRTTSVGAETWLRASRYINPADVFTGGFITPFVHFSDPDSNLHTEMSPKYSRVRVQTYVVISIINLGFHSLEING